VYLARGQILESSEPELLGKRVHLGVLQQLIACLVNLRDRGICL